MVQKESEMKFFYIAHGIVSFVCLKNLLEKGCVPEFVITHKDYEYEKLKDAFYAPVKNLCEKHSVPLYGVDKISEMNSEIANCDIGICLGFMEIVKKETLDLPTHGIVNIHGGKLPKYRGRAPITRSIMNGEKFFTLTLHKMDEGVDSGDVCLEMAIPITDKDDLNSLYIKCAAESAPLVERFFQAVERETLTCVKQDLSLNPKPYRKITDEERHIDWNKTSREIFNLVRALVPPFPGAFFIYSGKQYLALKANILLDNNVGKPGEILFAEENALIVKCAEGSLEIVSIADENLNPVTIIDTFKKGELLV